MLDNSKGNTDYLLKFIVDSVKLSGVSLSSVVSLRKSSVSLPAPAEILDQLVRETDVVVSAMADLVSCTSWSVHDMAELRKRRLITAVVCSNAFLKLGQTPAKIFGLPDLPMLVIRHPLGGINLESVKARAEVATPQLIELIKGSQESAT